MIKTVNFHNKIKFLIYDCVQIKQIRVINSQASQSQSSATSSLLSAVKVLTWNLAFTLNVCMDSVVLFSEKQNLVRNKFQKIPHYLCFVLTDTELLLESSLLKWHFPVQNYYSVAWTIQLGLYEPLHAPLVIKWSVWAARAPIVSYDS